MARINFFHLLLHPKKSFYVIPRFATAFLILLMLGLSGCGSGRQNADRRTNLRVINGNAQITAIDVLLDGRSFLESMGYLESTGYVNVRSGQREIRALVSGTLTTIGGTSFNLSDGNDQTLLVFGTAENPRSNLLRDDTDGAPKGSVKFQVIRVAEAAPRADVYILDSGKSVESVGPTVRSIGLGINGGYFEGLPGTYTVWVTVANSKEVLAVERDLVFEERGLYTILIADAPGGGEPITIVQLKG